MKWEYLTGAISDYVDGNQGYIFVSAIINEEHRITLNELGKKGWELVAIVENIAYFKRPLPELKPEDKAAIEGYVGGKIA